MRTNPEPKKNNRAFRRTLNKKMLMNRVVKGGVGHFQKFDNRRTRRTQKRLKQ